MNSSVSSFSGRISTKNFTNRNSLLAEVKGWIDSNITIVLIQVGMRSICIAKQNQGLTAVSLFM